MDRAPRQASVVVIGAGIQGNSMAYHLAKSGWKDIVLLDKGPLPNPGGSTGHAANFLFPVDHSKEMTKFTQDTIRQYKELGVFTESGGIEVARTPERVEELKRRLASAKAWGEPAELLTPAEVKELVPFINEDVVLGAFYTPGVGVVDSLRAGTLMREEGQRRGVLMVLANTEVTGIDVERGRIRGVQTSKGDIAAEVIVVACGVWSPRIARMAGTSIPLTPAVHQMIDVGPVPILADTVGEIGYPIIRDVDTNMYERQHGSEFEIGSYAHRPILVDPDDIPAIEESALSPTELPFTKEDFDLQMEHALELFPEILGDETVGIKYAVNGLLSLTPDGFPILGESPQVRGLWSVAAVWVKEAPGIGRTIVEWMTDGTPEIDPHSSDIARFYDHARTKTHIHARASEGYNKTYGIVHPAEQWLSNREVRVSPFFAMEQELGAAFIETAGWERPNWYESNGSLLDEYGDRVMPREAEWDARWWSPIINAEHLALRERVGLIDLSAFAVFDVTGPGALDLVQKVAVAQMDVPVGKVVYTSFLNGAGGVKADLTIMRLGPSHFRVVTGGITGQADRKWVVDHGPDDGSVQVTDHTSAWCTLGVWGPRARDLVQTLTPEDVSNEGFPFATCRWIDVGTVRVIASRISYVGELGWELHCPMEEGAKLWDTLWDAGQPLGVLPVGLGVYLTTGRLEKGYRAHGNELELEYNLVEAGMARRTIKEDDFIGKKAYLQQRDGPTAALLCTLIVDDHMSSSGVKRYMLGREPVLTPDGTALEDRKGRRSYVTSAGSGPSVGKHVLLAYLPPEQAELGRTLAVEYFGDRYPVTVAVVGSTPLFDPENTRVKS
ncbi:MAG: FAD-dependent oxidoreductase [Actinobacteria bacterium]|nr:MAG: FAD-dependent oxidoreductase [Actinomycetota bacterium]